MKLGIRQTNMWFRFCQIVTKFTLHITNHYKLFKNYLCYDLVESVQSREHWLWYVARRRTEFLLFSIVLRILQLPKTLEPLVRFRWVIHPKCTSPNEHFNHIEDWKCHIFDFRLISLDRIIFVSPFHVIQSCTHRTSVWAELLTDLPYGTICLLSRRVCMWHIWTLRNTENHCFMNHM